MKKVKRRRTKKPQLWKTGPELVRTVPGAEARRREIIIALCQGGVGMVSHYNAQPEAYGAFVVKVANRILEKTLQ